MIVVATAARIASDRAAGLVDRGRRRSPGVAGQGEGGEAVGVGEDVDADDRAVADREREQRDGPALHRGQDEMEARMNHPVMVVPEAMEALQGLSKAAAGTGVPLATLKMVELRASRINGAIGVWNRLNTAIGQPAGACPS